MQQDAASLASVPRASVSLLGARRAHVIQLVGDCAPIPTRDKAVVSSCATPPVWRSSELHDKSCVVVVVDVVVACEFTNSTHHQKSFRPTQSDCSLVDLWLLFIMRRSSESCITLGCRFLVAINHSEATLPLLLMQTFSLTHKESVDRNRVRVRPLLSYSYCVLLRCVCSDAASTHTHTSKLIPSF